MRHLLKKFLSLVGVQKNDRRLASDGYPNQETIGNPQESGQNDDESGQNDDESGQGSLSRLELLERHKERMKNEGKQ